MFCPSCGEKYAEGNSSCRLCYRLLPSELPSDFADGTPTAICPSCGKEAEADCFCRFCGSLFPPDLPVDPLRNPPDYTQTEGYKYRAGLQAKLAAQNQANLPTQNVQTDIAKAARKEAAGRKFRTYRIAMLESRNVCDACRNADGHDWPEDRPLGEICERGVVGCECVLVKQSV